MSLEKLQSKLQQNNISLSDAIVEALPQLREKETDETLTWLVNELQGYSNAMDFYSQSKHNLPPYRIVNGSLKLLGKDGGMVNVEHALARQDKYFLSSPISWVEDFTTLPGELSVAEMPEIAIPGSSGHVVLQLPKAQLLRILNEVKGRLLILFDKKI